VKPDDVRVGMEVEAVWKPDGEREGSILDIRYFRPRASKLRASRAPRTKRSGPKTRRGRPRSKDVAGGA
jgi:hypothetical protein